MSQVRRRQFLLTAGAFLIAPLGANAQQGSNVWRIGFLGVRSRSTSSNPEPTYEPLIRGMRDLGYVVIVTVAALVLFGCATNPPSQARYWILESCTAVQNRSVRFDRLDGATLAVVPRDSCARLVRAGEKIQAVAGYKIDQIFLLSQENPNAFATRDSEGRSVVVITIGMLSTIGSNEDAMAGLLGHEVAHHVMRHGDRPKSTAANTGLTAAPGIWGVSPGAAVLVAVGGIVVGTLRQSAYTRRQEAEADALGLKWLVEAGYDTN